MTYKEFIRGLKDRDIYMYFKDFISFLNTKDNKDKFTKDFCCHPWVSSSWTVYNDIFHACEDIVLEKQSPFSILDYCLWSKCAYGHFWEQTFYSHHARFRNSWENI